MMNLEAFRQQLARILLREPTLNEAAEIAVLALARTTAQQGALSVGDWRDVVGLIIEEDALPPVQHFRVRTAGLDFSALNVILASIHTQSAR